MLEIIQHTIGVCGDTHSHIDFIDLITFSSAESPILLTVKFYFNLSIIEFKNIFKL